MSKRVSRGESRSAKRDRSAAGRAVLEGLPKMSETMLAFARPLLDVFPDPPTAKELRHIMTLTTVAWNLPIYELRNHHQAAAHRAVFDQMQAQMPPQVAKILAAMLYARLTTYAHDPRTGFAEVVEGERGQAQVLATAALTDDWEGTRRPG